MTLKTVRGRSSVTTCVLIACDMTWRVANAPLADTRLVVIHNSMSVQYVKPLSSRSSTFVFSPHFLLYYFSPPSPFPPLFLDILPWLSFHLLTLRPRSFSVSHSLSAALIVPSVLLRNCTRLAVGKSVSLSNLLWFWLISSLPCCYTSEAKASATMKATGTINRSSVTLTYQQSFIGTTSTKDLIVCSNITSRFVSFLMFFFYLSIKKRC